MKELLKRQVPVVMIMAWVVLGIGSCTSAANSGSTASKSGTATASNAAPAAANTLYAIQQPGWAATGPIASSSGGAITVSNGFTSSNNNFVFQTPNFYGRNANSFAAYPAALTGDFSITATVTVTTGQTGAGSGIAIGMTTGFTATDKYAFTLLRNSGTVEAVYTTGSGSSGSVNAGTTATPYAKNTAVNVVFSRVGQTITYGVVGSTGTLPVTALADGSVNFGTGAIYPSVSFVRTGGTITNLVIKSGGTTLFDSANGAVANAPSLQVPQTTANVQRGSSQNLTVTALGPGSPGPVVGVSAKAANPAIAEVAVTNGATGSTLAIKGVAVGTTTVTVTNTSDSLTATNAKTIAVTVIDFPANDSAYGAIPAGRLYPAPGSTTAYTEGELAITFDAPPKLTNGGTIKIYKKADGSLADSIAFDGETQIIPVVGGAGAAASLPIIVGNQLARVAGNTLYITPHFNALAYGTAYFVAIPNSAVTGTLNGAAFNGLSNQASVATWTFTTRTAPTLANGRPVTVDGAQTSNANFRTVGGALMYLAANPVAGATAVNVSVAAGTYTELVNYRVIGANANPNLTITVSGPANNRGANCIIQYLNGGNINSAQNARATFFFAGANLVLQNLWLKSTGTRAAVNQAETIYFDSRSGYTLAANNCTFTSFQDTIQTSGRNWFYNCRIDGNVDFIWGTADAALFEKCQLQVIPDANQVYSIFVARTGTTGAPTIGKGYVLVNSTVEVGAGASATYGRNAGSSGYYDQVTLIKNTFRGEGNLADGLWVTTTPPLRVGDASAIGWKAAGNTGLSAETIKTIAGTSAVIDNQATHWNSRDQILNEVITLTNGQPAGYQPAASLWDTSALAKTWGAPAGNAGF